MMYISMKEVIAKQNELFQPIIEQFNEDVCKVSCRIVQEHLNWHIEATVLAKAGGANYSVVRRTRDLLAANEYEEYEMANEIVSLVLLLEKALSRLIIRNLNAPDLMSLIEDVKES